MAEQTKTRRGPLAWVKRHKKLTIFLVIVLAIALAITNVVRKANKAAAGTTCQYVRTTVLQKTTLSDSVKRATSLPRWTPPMWKSRSPTPS